MVTPSPRTRNAFTLLELLVVVAIIVVLIALLLPSLAAARERARLTICQGTQRSLFVALHVYASDQGQFPTIVNWSSPLDSQGKPSNWNTAPVTLPSNHSQIADDGTGDGGAVAGLLALTGVVLDLRTIRCNAPNPGSPWQSAEWYNVKDTYYQYASPGTCGSSLTQYGHGSGIAARSGLKHSNTWNLSPRGYSFRGDSRNAGNMAIASCRGFLLKKGTNVTVMEPHGKQPAAQIDGLHQYDNTWPARDRNYLYADGHVEYERKN